MGSFKKPCIWILSAWFLLGLSLGSPSLARARQPACGKATVDGDSGEWDLTKDFFAFMYRGGDSLKEVESELYLRDDCDARAMYALVLAVPHVPVLTEPDNTWIAVDGAHNKIVDGFEGHDGEPLDFAWLDDGHFRGDVPTMSWEASFSISEGSHEILAHSNVFADGTSQTSAVDSTTNEAGIELIIDCGERHAAETDSTGDLGWPDSDGDRVHEPDGFPDERTRYGPTSGEALEEDDFGGALDTWPATGSRGW